MSKRKFNSPKQRQEPAGNADRTHKLTALGLTPAQATAFDAFTNMAARTGWGTPSLTEGTSYELVRWSYDYWLLITLYRNHWIPRRIVDQPAADMVRAWPTLNTEVEPDDLSKIDKALRCTKTKAKIFEALKYARLFGGSGALIVIAGQEKELEEPLKPESIELGSYAGLIPFDRWTGISPDGNVCTDITKPADFNLPEFYRVQGPSGGSNFRVHSSRILRFTGPTVPTPEREAQSYWGVSVLESIYEELRKRDNLSANLINLSFRASLLGVQVPELGQMLSGAGMNGEALAAFYGRMEQLNHLLSNQGMMLLGKDGRMESVNWTASGWGELYGMFQMDIAGAAEMPVTRLFGRTVSGLGQSNDADEAIYEEKIAMDQDIGLRPQLEKLYPVIFPSELAEVPEDFVLKFPSIRVLDEAAKSTLATALVTNVTALVNAGILDKPTAMKELAQQSEMTGFCTNITKESIVAAEKAEAAGLGGLGEMEGFGGAEGAEPPTEGQPGQEQEEETSPTAAQGQQQPALRKLAPTASKEDVAAPVMVKTADSKVVDHLDFAGVPVSVEYPAGVRRVIKNRKSKIVYDRLMRFPYGFVDGVDGMDGDELDVVVGPDQQAPQAFIILMRDLGPDIPMRQDEYKLLVGFADEAAARAAFCTMYPANWIDGPVGKMSMDDLRRVVRKPETSNPEELFRFAFDSRVMAPARKVAGLHRALDHVLDAAEFEEKEHPRAKRGENAGQFVKKAGGAEGASKKSGGGMESAPASREQWPEHIKALKLPPAWTDVRISKNPNADLLAIGKDSKGRAQYVYSERFSQSQSAAKFARIKDLDAQFPTIEKQNAEDMRSDDPRRRDAAECARLVMSMGIRPGSDADTQAKVKAYGATTLEGRHVVTEGDQVYLRFTGKKGVAINLPVTDPAVAKILTERAQRAGSDGRLFGVRDSDLLDYTHSLDGGGFKTKDMRTRLGTSTAAALIDQTPEPKTEKEYKAKVREVAKKVSERLGNTPTVALQSYIAPEVWSKWRSALGTA